jgi:hypothetical protein
MPTILPDSAMFWLTIRGSARLLRSALYESPAARCRIAGASARGVLAAGAEQFVDLSGGIRQWLTASQYFVQPLDIWMRGCRLDVCGCS